MTIDPLANLEVEQAFLGALLLTGTDYEKVSYLRADDFSETMHKAIWWAIQAEVGRGVGPTSPGVVSRLAALPDGMGSGVEGYVRKLCNSVVTTINNPDYAKTLRDFGIRRALRSLGQEILESALDFSHTTEELIAKSITDLQGIAKDGSYGARTKRQVAEEVVNSLKSPPPCFQTGLPVFDSVIGGGLFSGKCYGIAARKKVGKTVLLGTISHNLNAAGHKHLFIALEMSPPELEMRNMAREFGINSLQFLKPDAGKLLTRSADYAVNVPDVTLYEAAPGASFDDVRRMVGRAIIQHGITGVILDYWQLVGGKQKSETEEYHLRNVAQWFADMCRRDKLWGLIAAQVNQEGNTRGGEGLKLACDVYFTLNREKDQQGAFLEMEESRYVLYANVGSEGYPGLWLQTHGPYFSEEPAPVRTPYADL